MPGDGMEELLVKSIIGLCYIVLASALMHAYRDIFRSYRDTNVHGIYGDRQKNDRDRRKYTKSDSAGSTSVRHTRCVHIPYPIEIYLNV